MKIAIVDYGMGNTCSIKSTLSHLGVNDVILSDNYNVLKTANKIILPGVGSFAKAISRIKNKKINIFLDKLVLEKKTPILGICLGMQLLCDSSEEDGINFGLGYINATVERFNHDLKIPHTGFNQVEINNKSLLYNKIDKSPDFYFTHSFKVISHENINQCYCDYGNKFIASFELDNIYGVQFHPELSQSNGLQLIKNFIEN